MNDRKPITDADREMLVSWLDGESDSGGATECLSRLSTDQMLQKEVEGYKRTWDLLDELPMPPPARDFTSRTVSLASQELMILRESAPSEEPAIGIATSSWWQRPVPFALLLAVCFGVSFAATRQGLGRSRRMVELAPILTKLDEYRAAGDIEFLRELYQQKVFEPAPVETVDSASLPTGNFSPRPLMTPANPPAGPAPTVPPSGRTSERNPSPSNPPTRGTEGGR